MSRSNRHHLWETSAAALRLRVGEMEVIIFDRISSGRSLMDADAAILGLPCLCLCLGVPLAPEREGKQEGEVLSLEPREDLSAVPFRGSARGLCCVNRYQKRDD